MKLEREFTADNNKANAEKIIDEEKEIEYLTLFYLNECSDIFNTLLINDSYLDKNYKSNNLDVFINFMEQFEPEDHSGQNRPKHLCTAEKHLYRKLS